MSLASSARISGGPWTFKKGGEPILRPCHLGSTYQDNDSNELPTAARSGPAAAAARPQTT
jgi:hypothetical protein